MVYGSFLSETVQYVPSKWVLIPSTIEYVNDDIEHLDVRLRIMIRNLLKFEMSKSIQIALFCPQLNTDCITFFVMSRLLWIIITVCTANVKCISKIASWVLYIIFITLQDIQWFAGWYTQVSLCMVIILPSSCNNFFWKYYVLEVSSSVLGTIQNYSRLVALHYPITLSNHDFICTSNLFRSSYPNPNPYSPSHLVIFFSFIYLSTPYFLSRFLITLFPLPHRTPSFWTSMEIRACWFEVSTK